MATNTARIKTGNTLSLDRFLNPSLTEEVPYKEKIFLLSVIKLINRLPNPVGRTEFPFISG